MSHLDRTTFTTSRLLDFASEKELTAQTGHPVRDWPEVILKELLDNALDACEEAGIVPVISVDVDDDGITVIDNGPGIRPDVVSDILDFGVRVSSREAYVSPARGAQGNALKTIVAMPFVLDGERGKIEIEALGVRHVIEMTVDRIEQTPVIDHRREPSDVKIGTAVRVVLPRSNVDDAEGWVLQLAENYAWLNPNLTLAVNWRGERTDLFATNDDWSKWRPSYPTSPHWYDRERFERLIAGYISHDRETDRLRTVREFVAEFKGLSASAKQKAVLDVTGLAREPLTALLNGSGLDGALCHNLLRAMQKNSGPVKPEGLGVIGRDHFYERLENADCEMESFQYKRITDTLPDGMPWVVEAAFAWNGEDADEDDDGIIVTGINWSPSIIGINPFRDLGNFGSLDTLLEERRVRGSEPVTLVLHLTCPLINYTDRGKSAVALPPDIAYAIIDAVRAVTNKWAKQRRREERERSAEQNRRNVLTRRSSKSIRDAAWEIMAEAYDKVSSGDRYPALARQIMYAARPHIQNVTGKALSDTYFTQTLLPDYIAENGVEWWNVVFDARGSMVEPHTNTQVPLGTLRVRKYLDRVHDYQVPEPTFDVTEEHYPTAGPRNRFSAVLFIEKEGFLPLFSHVQLAERYDLAIMSTKGTSVVAARSLVDAICSDHDIPLLVLHDFDIAGFSILGTLQGDTRRYKFENDIRVIDLGLRLEDIVGLEDEAAAAIKSPAKTRETLLRHGATEAEADYLLERRVELNAFTSEGLITWLEGKLVEHGIAKVVPDEETLEQAFRRMRRQAVIRARIDEVLAEFNQADMAAVPPDLGARIAMALKKEPALPWDLALQRIVEMAPAG